MGTPEFDYEKFYEAWTDPFLPPAIRAMAIAVCEGNGTLVTAFREVFGWPIGKYNDLPLPAEVGVQVVRICHKLTEQYRPADVYDVQDWQEKYPEHLARVLVYEADRIELIQQKQATLTKPEKLKKTEKAETHTSEMIEAVVEISKMMKTMLDLLIK